MVKRVNLFDAFSFGRSELRRAKRTRSRRIYTYLAQSTIRANHDFHLHTAGSKYTLIKILTDISRLPQIHFQRIELTGRCPRDRQRSLSQQQPAVRPRAINAFLQQRNSINSIAIIHRVSLESMSIEQRLYMRYIMFEKFNPLTR